MKTTKGIISVMMLIAENPLGITIRRIAEDQGISKRHAARQVAHLAEFGLVQSKKGWAWPCRPLNALWNALERPTAKGLREIRERAGLTQSEAAQRLGITRDRVAHYETGRRSIPVDWKTVEIEKSLSGCAKNGTSEKQDIND